MVLFVTNVALALAELLTAIPVKVPLVPEKFKAVPAHNGAVPPIKLPLITCPKELVALADGTKFIAVLVAVATELPNVS
jgi:hypothetical protein